MALDAQTPGGAAHQHISITSLGTNLYLPTLATSSLTGFYDDVVFWEITKNTNKFFVTFERGQYAILNNKQESIATMEIHYPHVSNSTSSNNITAAGEGGTRKNGSSNMFLSEDEQESSPFLGHHYNGFIPITELKGTRFFQSTITSSISKSFTLDYEISSSVIKKITKSVTASYFYPFSSHQLSVLRTSPTLIIDLDKSSELDGYEGLRGFAAIPANTHEKVKDNLEFYLEKAGLINKTTKTKAPRKGK